MDEGEHLQEQNGSEGACDVRRLSGSGERGSLGRLRRRKREKSHRRLNNGPWVNGECPKPEKPTCFQMSDMEESSEMGEKEIEPVEELQK